MGRLALLCALLCAAPIAQAAELGCTESGGVCCIDGPNACNNDCDCDGITNDQDNDDDNDGVCDSNNDANTDCIIVTINNVTGDPLPFNPLVCGDVDNDGCDDCSRGNTCFWDFTDPQNASNDAAYQACVASIQDAQGLTVGQDGFGPAANFNGRDDGADHNNDGECEVDNDNDGVADLFAQTTIDPDPNNPNICGDADNDGCDDCSIGVDGTGGLSDRLPGNDGADFDGDGLCDVGDPDIDGDGGPNATDPDDMDATVCGDVPFNQNGEVDLENGVSDGDLCDDCTNGMADPNNDGPDANNDGFCENNNDEDGDGIACLVSAGCVDGTDCGKPAECYDNCPQTANPDQADFNNNGIGDACDSERPGETNLYGCQAPFPGLILFLLVLFSWALARNHNQHAAK